MGVQDLGIICTDDAIVVLGLKQLEQAPDASMRSLLDQLRELGMGDLL